MYAQLKKLMLEYGLHVSAEDIQLLIYRLDKDKDAKVNFLEFKQGLAPSRFHMYQSFNNNGLSSQHFHYSDLQSPTYSDIRNQMPLQ